MTGAGPLSPWTDLDRPPLSARRLRAALARDGWQLDVVPVTGSTNADLAEAARAGAPHATVLVAEEQSRGRGRLDRQWTAPPRSALLMSLLVRPSVPSARWTMLPFIAGLAAVEAVRAVARVDVSLKWPNDVVFDGRKLGGILVERVEAAVIVGVGINVSLRADELPVPQATSLALLAGQTDRESLLKELVRAFGRHYQRWVDADGVPTAVLPAYRSVCATIGQDVTVELPGGGIVTGTATAVDEVGCLVVTTPGGDEHALSVGDVVHVRPGA